MEELNQRAANTRDEWNASDSREFMEGVLQKYLEDLPEKYRSPRYRPHRDSMVDGFL